MMIVVQNPDKTTKAIAREAYVSGVCQHDQRIMTREMLDSINKDFDRWWAIWASGDEIRVEEEP